MTKKGNTLIGFLATITISSIVLLTLTQLTVFLLKAQTRIQQNNEMVRDSVIVQQSIMNAITQLRPTSYQTCATYTYCYEFIGDVNDPHLIIGFNGTGNNVKAYVYYDNESEYEIPLKTYMRSPNFGLTTCTSCPEDDIFVVQYRIRSITSDELSDLKTRFAFTLY